MYHVTVDYILLMFIHHPCYQEPGEGGEEEEEEEEEAEMEEEEEAEVGLSPEVLERLVRRPEDLPTHVEENITRYKKNMLRILEVHQWGMVVINNL